MASSLSEPTRTLLSALLDKYERSSAFRTGEVPARAIQVRVDEKLLPGYVSGALDPDARRRMHEELRQLEAAGALELRWVRYEEGNLLERVRLVPQAAETLYPLVARPSLRRRLDQLLRELADLEAALSALPESAWSTRVMDWVQRWLDDVRKSVQERARWPQSVPEEGDKRAAWWGTLRGLAGKGEEPLPVRLFSKRYLGHSKALERLVLPRLVSWLRTYAIPDVAREVGVDPGIYASDEAVLASVGIELGHEDVSFCGPVRLRWPSEEGDAAELDARRIPHGVSLDPAALRGLTLDLTAVRRILTIENKTNYRHYIRYERQPDELVIYLGGFASPAMRSFLRCCRAAAMERGELPPLLHWGDLDYGGILILQSVRDSVWPEAMPWRMEPEWLDELRAFVDPFDDAYRARLEALLADPRYAWAAPLIRKLLEVGGGLEQEAQLV